MHISNAGIKSKQNHQHHQNAYTNYLTTGHTLGSIHPRHADVAHRIIHIVVRCGRQYIVQRPCR